MIDIKETIEDIKDYIQEEFSKKYIIIPSIMLTIAFLDILIGNLWTHWIIIAILIGILIYYGQKVTQNEDLS